MAGKIGGATRTGARAEPDPTAHGVAGALGALVVLSVLAFVPGLRESFEPVKVAVARTIGLALIPLCVLPGAARVRRHPLDLAVAAWLLVELASTLASRAPLLSVVGEPVQREGLLTSLALAGAYTAARNAWGMPVTASAATRDLDRRDRSMVRTFALAIAAGAVASLVAVLQALGHDPTGWAPSFRVEGGSARSFGTLGHPNLMGIVVAPLACCAMAMSSRLPAHRPVLAGATGLLMVACVLTLSRGAWLGLAAGGIAMLVIALWSRARSGARRTAAPELSPRAATPAEAPARARSSTAVPWVVVLIVATMAVVALVLARGGIVGRALDVSTRAGTGATRVEFWRSALEAWRARPLLGTGPDTFALVFPQVQTPLYWKLEWGGLPVHAHSIYLHALATRGIAGGVAGLAGLGAVVLAWRAAWRGRADRRWLLVGLAGMTAALLVAGGFGALGITGALLTILGSAAVASMAAERPAGDAPSEPVRTGGVPLAGRLVLATLVGAVALAFGVADIASSRAGRAASELVERVRTGEPSDVGAQASSALRHAERALRLAPLDDLNHRVLSEAWLAMAFATATPASMLDRADHAATRALALVRDRAENHEQRARTLVTRALLGDSAAGAEALIEIRRFVSLAPVNGLALGEAAQLELLLGQPRLARESARRLVELYPERGPAWLTLAVCERANGNPGGATEALVQGLRADWQGDTASLQHARELLAQLRAAAPH